MVEQPYLSPSTASTTAWYRRWWVWLIAAVLVVGGIGALVSPEGSDNSGDVQPTQAASAEPSASATAPEVAPLDLEAFLTESGVAFDSAEISARKAYIYVPTETSNEEAQQIANDAMRYICDHAAQAGDSFPAANRVEVTDGVSPITSGYHAADHPSGFATDDICQS